MVRISKKAERRSQSRRRPSPPSKKTGPRNDNLAKGFKIHANALEGDLAEKAFIPKIK